MKVVIDIATNNDNKRFFEEDYRSYCIKARPSCNLKNNSKKEKSPDKGACHSCVTLLIANDRS